MEWIASIPAAEKDALLARVAAGEGAQVQALVLRGFRAATGPSSTRRARDPADLLEETANRIDARAAALEERNQAEAARRAATRAAAYTKHLDQLATRTEAAWEKVDEWIATRRPGDYDLAVSLLRDLQALAERQDDSAAFRERFDELRAQHLRKPSLLDRFDRAGLPS